MRIADRVLKCAVFLGTVEGRTFKPLGTGFLVRVQAGAVEFQYVVTCQHNVIMAGTRPLHIRVNRKAGDAEVGPEIGPDEWVFHPQSASRFVDVAILPVQFPYDVYDIAAIKFADLWDRDKVAERNIGVGEDLFYPGLFRHHSGEANNLPVMRSGTLAAMPLEPVGTARGPIEAYLMESRSIGGHSGSPVFANLFDRRNFYTDRRTELPDPFVETRYPVLGLLRSYFKTVDESLTASPDADDLALNSGISTIIPAWEIIETLNRQDLVEGRAAGVAEYNQSRGGAETEASVVPATGNSSHKEDFTRLLNAASKAK